MIRQINNYSLICSMCFFCSIQFIVILNSEHCAWSTLCLNYISSSKTFFQSHPRLTTIAGQLENILERERDQYAFICNL